MRREQIRQVTRINRCKCVSVEQRARKAENPSETAAAWSCERRSKRSSQSDQLVAYLGIAFQSSRSGIQAVSLAATSNCLPAKP